MYIHVHILASFCNLSYFDHFWNFQFAPGRSGGSRWARSRGALFGRCLQSIADVHHHPWQARGPGEWRWLLKLGWCNLWNMDVELEGSKLYNIIQYKMIYDCLWCKNFEQIVFLPGTWSLPSMLLVWSWICWSTPMLCRKCTAWLWLDKLKTNNQM